MNDCAFCQIVAGKIPAEKVYEDESVLAFLDIHPVNPGHTLVVPKNHVEEFQDMSEDLYGHVFSVVQKLARDLKQRLQAVRVGLVVEGFDVAHVHVHVFPINGLGDITTKRTREDMQSEPDFATLKQVAEKLRS